MTRIFHSCGDVAITSERLQILTATSTGFKNLTHFFEKFKFANNFWTVSTRALIFNMNIPCGKTFLWVSYFYHVTLTLEFDPFLAHLSWKLKWAFLITLRPSSVCPSVCPSVRLSVCNFSHFHLLLQNHWANFNQTWHKASLGEGDSSLFKWRAPPFSKGR